MICRRCSKEIPEGSRFCNLCGSVQIKKVPRRVRGNGTGTAFRRGKTWVAQVTLGWSGDKRILKTKCGFKTKAEALDYLPILRADQVKAKCPMLSAYWDIYESGELDRLSDDKRTAYKIAWNRMAILSRRPVDSLTVFDLRECVSSQTSTYYPARDMKNLFSHLFKLAAADGYAQKDLPSMIILPELKETQRIPFNEEEQKSLWNLHESGNPDAALPLIMIYTGMMPAELRSLKVSMIDFDNRKIIGVGKKTKVRKESPIYIPECLLPILRDLCQDKLPEALLVPGCENNFYERYYAALSSAGCRRLTPYSCRHTTATALAIDKNIAPQTVTRIMRWSTSRMLDRYAHPDDQAIKDAVNSL